MANKIKGEVSIKHEDKDYTLVLDFNALCDFEAETGRGALDFLDEIESGKIRVTDIRALMWAGLKLHHPDITLRDAGLIAASNNGAVMEAVAASFGGEGEPKTEGAAGNGRKGKAPRG